MNGKPGEALMRSFLGRILFYVRPYKGQTTLLVAGMIAGVAYDTMLPVSFKFLIDDAIVPRNWQLLTIILLMVATGGIVVSLIAVGRDYLYARLSAAILKDLRLRIFDHLQDLPIEFYGRTRPGDITAGFSIDLSSIENALVLALPVGIMSCMGVLFSMVVLFVLQWEMALAAISGIFICLIGPKLIARKAAHANAGYKNEQARLLDIVGESINAQSVIKVFSLKRVIMKKFQDQAFTLSHAAMRANFISFLLERAPGVGILAFHIIIMCVGAVLAFRGDLSVGALVSFNAVFVCVSRSVYDVTVVLPQLIQAAAGMDRIERILGEEIKTRDEPSGAILPPLVRDIAFRDVSFGYSQDQLILNKANILIPRGSTVAFVGSSGSGKTTAVNLLMRLHDPWEGAVTFDDVDLRDITMDSLRSQLGVVLQENFLFNMSIRENIRLGRPEAGDTDIQAAARAAEIEGPILDMPKGYDTIVGDRGGKLSGGQRQRVAIARALVRNPHVLILDEATSALDPVTESAINNTLRRIGKERTVVSVTHRLSSISHADQIYVFEDGQIVEQGRHEDLVKKKGYYDALWRKQSGFVLSGDGEMAGVTVERLKLIPILSDLDDGLLREISGLFVTEHYPNARVIVQQGDPGDRFYIIVRGRVVVSKRGGDGGEQMLNVLEDGDYFGEIALLSNVPRSATATTTVPTVFLTLQRDLFHSLMKRFPFLRQILEERMANY
ncbi:MAG: ABC transporter ATP-binding protein [Syntrophus sp. (in: bacteria)]|nr:ABC transporter ATP-binding protein [Syntrophus sp. (in: bacteria)]